MFAAASKSGRAGSAAPTTDASFGYVPLLLETGSSSSLNTTVTDSSASPKTVTRVSNPSTGWVSPYQTGGYWGNQFNGTNAYLSVVRQSAFLLGTNNFTIEFWVYFNSVASAQTVAGSHITSAAGDWLIYTATNGNLNYYLSSTGSTWNIANQVSIGAVVTGVWYHVALVRNGSVFTPYLNGVAGTTTNSSASLFASSAPVSIAASNNPSTYFSGYVSNFRMVNGTAIVPPAGGPTSPLTAVTNTVLLTCQSNRFIDNSTANSGVGFPITVNGTPQVDPYFYPSGFTAPAASPGAGLFAAASSQTLITTQTQVIPTGNFTIEVWAYVTSSTATQVFVSQGTSGSAGRTAIGIDNSSGAKWFCQVGGVFVYSSAAPTLNTWNYLAMTYNGATIALYLNGTLLNSASNTTSAQNSQLRVGGLWTPATAGYYLDGYLSNIRVSNTVRTVTSVPTTFLTSDANTTLLLNLADSNYNSATNGVQNNTFIDNSNYAFPITRNGTPTQGSITPYWPNGQWSNNFNGSSNLSVASNAALAMGSGNFTVEFWVYLRATTNNRTLSWPSVGNMAINCANSGYWNYSSYGVGDILTSSIITPLNTWTHVAVSRTGTTTRIFINGVQGAITTVDANNWGQSVLNIGSDIAANFLNGYLSNLRIVKGVGVYTGAFTPPTSPLQKIQAGNGGTIQAITGTQTSLLTCQSNRFVNNSDISLTLTVANGTPTVQAFQPFSPAASYTTALYGGSGYFNGSTDYLSETDLTPTTFGTGDFTIEFWHYLISKATAYPIVFYISGNSSGTSNVRIEFDATHNISGPTSYNIYAPGLIINAGTVAYNTWSHIALVRSSNTLTLYLNGASIGSASVTGVSFGGTGTGLRVMGDGGASNYAYGYLSNFRIVKGTAVYTAAFTPPTSPVTAITNTSLLLNMTNAGIYDAAAQNVITTVGDAQVSNTITAQFPPTSVRFDGTGDQLRLVDAPVFDLGSSDFTIEAWIYTPSSGSQVIYSRETATSTFDGILFMLSTGTLRTQLSSNGGTYALILDGSAVSTNTWTYVALTRSGSGTNNIKLYQGTTPGAAIAAPSGQGTFASAIYTTTGMTPVVGARNTNGELSFNGYIQDFRITRGVGRTISTVPSASFPTR